MLLEQVLTFTLNDLLKEKRLSLPEEIKSKIIEAANSFVINDGSFVAVAVDEALNDYLSTKEQQNYDELQDKFTCESTQIMNFNTEHGIQQNSILLK